MVAVDEIAEGRDQAIAADGDRRAGEHERVIPDRRPVADRDGGIMVGRADARALFHDRVAVGDGKPSEANGQWRFPWEFGWHNSGFTASNLVRSDYAIEFRNVAGYLAQIGSRAQTEYRQAQSPGALARGFRAIAVLALIGGLLLLAASPASAARPRCFGKRATIRGDREGRTV